MESEEFVTLDTIESNSGVVELEEQKVVEEIDVKSETNKSHNYGRLFFDEVKSRLMALRSVFMFYFIVTVLCWGSADFLLSYLATRSESLPTGDTLAFLSIGNFIGTCFSRFVLWRWKKTSWGKYTFSAELTINNVAQKNEENTVKKFSYIRSMITKPMFLQDAFKLAFLGGVIGSVAPLGYYQLSARGGEASTVAPLISLYVIIPTVLGLFVLNERKSVLKFLGIFSAIGAVVLFALGGGTKHWSLMSWENIGFFSLGFFGWGISYFIRSVAASKASEFAHLLLMATAGLMFGNYTLVLFIFGVHPFRFSQSHLLTVTSGAFSVFGDLGFFLLSKEGKEASRVVPLTGTYILVPTVFGLLFLHDIMNTIKACAIFLSLIALILLGAS